MVSPRKSVSSVNLVTEEYGSTGAVNKLTPSNRKSCESLYSAPSSRASASLVYRRKLPSNFGNRPPTLIPATTEVQQRVISARRLRFKNVQNQLGLAQHKITELSNELRVLRTLHKRQNSALAKYESTNAELPRLLHSHAEELRVWQTKYRTLQVSHKELEQKTKQKEAVILALGDENKYYSQLNKDKNLEDRQRLAEKLQSLELRLQEKENQMKVVERRAHLEIKNLKQQLLNEQKKAKDVMQKLEKTKMELSNYQKLDELNITEKMTGMTLKQSTSKLDIKASAKRLPKDKPYGGSNARMNSTTPSPVLDGATGATIAIAEEDDSDFSNSHCSRYMDQNKANPNDEDSDFPISHRSQKSNNSSFVDFSTTRTVRKLPLSKNKNQTKSTAANVTAEMIGDGPEIKKKSDINEKKYGPRKPGKKMMVNMPNFDSADGADGDTSLTCEDDADVILGGNIVDSNGSSDQCINYNYNDDFDENDDVDDNRHKNLGGYMNENPSNGHNHHHYKYSHGNIGYDDDEIAGSKEDMLSLRKQITDDYKDREAFLDTFCRQATGSGQQRNKNDGDNNGEATASRKHKLLAALKAIDDDQCSSQD